MSKGASSAPSILGYSASLKFGLKVGFGWFDSCRKCLSSMEWLGDGIGYINIDLVVFDLVSWFGENFGYGIFLGPTLFNRERLLG